MTVDRFTRLKIEDALRLYKLLLAVAVVALVGSFWMDNSTRNELRDRSAQVLILGQQLKIDQEQLRLSQQRDHRERLEYLGLDLRK